MELLEHGYRNPAIPLLYSTSCSGALEVERGLVFPDRLLWQGEKLPRINSFDDEQTSTFSKKSGRSKAGRYHQVATTSRRYTSRHQVACISTTLRNRGCQLKEQGCNTVSLPLSASLYSISFAPLLSPLASPYSPVPSILPLTPSLLALKAALLPFLIKNGSLRS